MGWSFSQNATKTDIVNELRGHLAGKIVTDAVVGQTYYAAVRHTTKQGEGPDSYVCAVVCLLQGDRNYGWGYKDMDEFCGPYEATCPARVLDALTPIDDIITIDGGKRESHDWAQRWRTQCRERLSKAAAQRKALKTLTVGQWVWLRNVRDPQRPFMLIQLPSKGVPARVARDYCTYRVAATRILPTAPEGVQS